MGVSSQFEQRRRHNAKKLERFGFSFSMSTSECTQVVREGTKVTIFTVGYEKRDGADLISVLQQNGILALADVRERPLSRKPEFRATALRELCTRAGIEYQSWQSLGSTAEQRESLQESGDFRSFERKFRAYAVRTMKPDIAKLADQVKRIPTALLCYERSHGDCHRSIIADLVADVINATVVAIL